jgi:hypothetical protein
MNHHSCDMVRNLNGSLVLVLEEWCRGKSSEMRLERAVKAGRERAGLIALENTNTLKETIQAGQEELKKAHGKIGRNRAVMTAQAEYISFLSPYTAKVSTYYLFLSCY